jgi:hypothetical protein
MAESDENEIHTIREQDIYDSFIGQVYPLPGLNSPNNGEPHPHKSRARVFRLIYDVNIYLKALHAACLFFHECVYTIRFQEKESSAQESG